MKSLVIYDSQFGNTEKVAEVIARILNSKAVKVSDFKKEYLEEVKIFIIGSPIQGWRPLPSISDFLSSLPAGSLKNIFIAAFDTRVKLFIHGDAAGKINNMLINLGGKEVIPPRGFIVKGTEGPLEEGELEKAQSWAKKIKEKASSE